MDRDATLQFLKDQLHDLQLDLDDAQGQLHLQQHGRTLFTLHPMKCRWTERSIPRRYRESLS